MGELAGFEAVAADPRYADDGLRRANATTLQEEMTEVFATDTAAAWAGAFDAVGVPCEVCAPPNAQERFFDDAHHEQLGRHERYQHETWGEVQDVAVMLRLSRASRKPSRPAPLVGEHTDEIMTMLGYSHDEIGSLRSAEAIR